MKNVKIKLSLVTLLMSTGLLMGCSGVNIGPEEKPHEHALVSVDAKEATYYKQGNIKYYYCPDCNKKFSDSMGTIEVSDADVILNKKTILEETIEVEKEAVELVLQTAVVETGDTKYVSLEKEEDDVTGLYVASAKKDDYTTISLNFSKSVEDIVSFSFDYRYLDNCNDRQYDMLGHNFITKKLDGEQYEHTYVPHTNGKLNNDCAWHTFSYQEKDNLEGSIDSLKINIYHFDGELVINNVLVIHHVDATPAGTDPAVVAHYEDLEGYCYWYNEEEDEYELIGGKESAQIIKQPGQTPSCEQPGYKDYYWCEYTREYYEDENGVNIITDLKAWKEQGGGGYLKPTHSLTEEGGTPATCTTSGVKSHYHCSKCGKNYSDADGLHVIENLTEWEAGEGKIEALGHAFGEDGNCTRTGCSVTIKNYLGLEDASRSDLVTKISLSGIGVNAPTWTSLSADHVWGSHDLVANKGIDLTFDIQLDATATSESLFVYVGSKGQDETGMKFRFDYNSGTQAYGGYIYGSSDNDLPGAAETNGTKYTIPDFTTTEKTITARITLTQDTSNPYKFAFALYVNGHKATAPNPDYPLKESVTFDSTGARNVIRFSQTSKSKIKESTVENPVELILMSGNTIYGKKTDFTSPVTMPNMAKEGYKFLGWFDNKSNKMANTISSLDTKTIVKPVFVKNETNMYALSDFGFDTKGKVIHPTGEKYDKNDSLPKNISRIDTYFIVNTTTFTTNDPYFYFGIPYAPSSVDARVRVQARVSLTASNNWYWHAPNTSIGGAGSSGTNFKPDGLTWVSGCNYLFHVYIAITGKDDFPFKFGFEITNLSDMTNYVSEKEFKFTNDVGYTLGDKEKSQFCFVTDSSFGSADFTVTDAW